MIKLDSITNENNKENNERWPYIADHPYIECRKILRGEKKIIEGFKEKIFPIYCDETLEEEARYEEEEKSITNENGLINYKKLARLIDFKIRDLNDELVREYFLVQDLGSLLEKLQKS